LAVNAEAVHRAIDPQTGSAKNFTLFSVPAKVVILTFGQWRLSGQNAF
jgi:hypothetical protein